MKGFRFRKGADRLCPAADRKFLVRGSKVVQQQINLDHERG
jgi:hypothetical protein